MNKHWDNFTDSQKKTYEKEFYKNAKHEAWAVKTMLRRGQEKEILVTTVNSKGEFKTVDPFDKKAKLDDAQRKFIDEVKKRI